MARSEGGGPHDARSVLVGSADRLTGMFSDSSPHSSPFNSSLSYSRVTPAPGKGIGWDNQKCKQSDLVELNNGEDEVMASSP